MRRYYVATILLLVLSLIAPTPQTIYGSNQDNSGCNLKILIQVAYNTTKNDNEGKLYLYDSKLQEALIRKEGDRDVGIIPDLIKWLEQKGCNVEVDWQFNTGRPRYWWTREYSGGASDANLISEYNIVIFLGHGYKHGIELTISDRNAHGDSYRSVDLAGLINRDGQVYPEVHMRNKGWILFISCRVMDNYRMLTQVFTGIPISGRIDYSKLDLSNTTLLAITGFHGELVIGYQTLLGESNLMIDFFINSLVWYLAVEGRNIRDAWFRAYRDYKTYAFHNGLPFRNAYPVVMYPRIYLRDGDRVIEIYSPLSGIHRINLIDPPSSIYKKYSKDKLIIQWVFEVNEFRVSYLLNKPRGGALSLFGFGKPMVRRILIR